MGRNHLQGAAVVPIKEVTFYQVACDTCGEVADYGDYAAWAQPEGATESLGDDWTQVDDKFFCDNCRPPDEDDADTQDKGNKT